MKPMATKHPDIPHYDNRVNQERYEAYHRRTGDFLQGQKDRRAGKPKQKDTDAYCRGYATQDRIEEMK